MASLLSQETFLGTDASSGHLAARGMMELLHEAVRQYALYRPLRPKSLYHLEHAVQLFSQWLSHEASVRDFEPDSFNGWVCWLESQYSRRTVAGYRANLLTIWKDCAERDLVSPPRRIRRVSKPKPKPEAWTVEQVNALLRYAKRLPGRMKNGVRRAVYFDAFVRVAWATGLRRTDIWNLERGDIRNNSIYVRQSKTGEVKAWPIPERTVAILDNLPGERPLHWPQSEWMFDYWFKILKVSANVQCGKHAHGVRCSAATNLVRNGASPQQVQQFLGHKCLESQQNYVDTSIAIPELPRPEPLEDA